MYHKSLPRRSALRFDVRGSSWPQVDPACPLTLPHTHYTQSSCLVGFLGWKHGWNRPNGLKLPMNRSLPYVFLSQRLKTAILVTVALRYSRYTGKKFQNVKNFSPPRTVISLAWWWPQKNLHFVHLGQKSWGFKVQHIKKWCKSAKFQCRFGGRLTFRPATQAKKVEIQIFFFPRIVTSLAWWWTQKNLDFGHSRQSYRRLKFRQKVPKCGGFLSSEHPVDIFPKF